jgi:hypothetical protein
MSVRAGAKMKLLLISDEGIARRFVEEAAFLPWSDRVQLEKACG